MNKRKILTMILISAISIGSLVGCGNTDKKELSKNKIQVKTNNSNGSNSDKNIKQETGKATEETKEAEKTEKLTEETSLQIAIDGFKTYFNEELKKEDFQAYEAHLSSEYETEHFVVESNDLVKSDYDEYPKYRAEIDAITGKIRFMGCFAIEEAEDYNNFDVEKGKSAAIDFIKEHDLLDADKIEFIDDLTAEEKEFSKKEPFYFYSFKAEEGSLVIRVDKVGCEVGMFKFQQPIIMED